MSKFMSKSLYWSRRALALLIALIGGVWGLVLLPYALFVAIPIVYCALDRVGDGTKLGAVLSVLVGFPALWQFPFTWAWMHVHPDWSEVREMASGC